jgi:hypothetical protein
VEPSKPVQAYTRILRHENSLEMEVCVETARSGQLMDCVKCVETVQGVGS